MTIGKQAVSCLRYAKNATTERRPSTGRNVQYAESGLFRLATGRVFAKRKSARKREQEGIIKSIGGKQMSRYAVRHGGQTYMVKDTETGEYIGMGSVMHMPKDKAVELAERLNREINEREA